MMMMVSIVALMKVLRSAKPRDAMRYLNRWKPRVVWRMNLKISIDIFATASP